MGAYKYTECGLDNVIIEGMKPLSDDGSEECFTIRNVNGLHRVIALGIVRKKTGLNGKELRFLRTEVGLTQAALAKVVHREALTISRWERGEDAMDRNAEAVIRIWATQELHLPTSASVSEISGWCIQDAEAPSPPLVIDGADPSNYRLKKAA